MAEGSRESGFGMRSTQHSVPRLVDSDAATLLRLSLGELGGGRLLLGRRFGAGFGRACLVGGLVVGFFLAGGAASFLAGGGAGQPLSRPAFFLSSFAAAALPLAAAGGGLGGGAGGSGGLRFGSRSLHLGSISSSSLRAFGPYGLRPISTPSWCSSEPISTPLFLLTTRSKPGHGAGLELVVGDHADDVHRDQQAAVHGNRMSAEGRSA